MSSIAKIIVKRILKQTDAQTSQELEQWMSLSERNRVFVEYLTGYLSDDTGREIDSKHLRRAWQRLISRIEVISGVKPRSKCPRYWIPRIVASIAAVMVISTLSIYVAYRSGLGFSPAQLTVSTQAGQQSRTELPDGTVVWINHETVLRYTDSKTRREVCLEGEATFEVSKNVFRPFTIQAGQTGIMVTGTKFNVRNYPSSKKTEVALISGSIRMRIPGQEDAVNVQPGEKVTFHEDEKRLSRSIVDPNNSIVWQNGILVFENEPFAQLIERLERCYAVDVIYDRCDFEDVHYTGAINNLSIEKVLEFIKITVDIEYKIDNRTIYIE